MVKQFIATEDQLKKLMNENDYIKRGEIVFDIMTIPYEEIGAGKAVAKSIGKGLSAAGKGLVTAGKEAGEIFRKM